MHHCLRAVGADGPRVGEPDVEMPRAFPAAGGPPMTARCGTVRTARWEGKEPLRSSGYMLQGCHDAAQNIKYTIEPRSCQYRTTILPPSLRCATLGSCLTEKFDAKLCRLRRRSGSPHRKKLQRPTGLLEHAKASDGTALRTGDLGRDDVLNAFSGSANRPGRRRNCGIRSDVRKASGRWSSNWCSVPGKSARS